MVDKDKAKIARHQIDKIMALHQFEIAAARANNASRATFNDIAKSNSAKIGSLLVELNLTIMTFIDLLLIWRNVEEAHGCGRAAAEYKYIIHMLAGREDARWNGAFQWQDHYR